MDELVDDDDNQQVLIEFLSKSIERWEDFDDGFREFNQRTTDGTRQHIDTLSKRFFISTALFFSQ